MNLTRRELARHIDHTLLNPTATASEIRNLCEEAVEWECYSVCVASSRIETAVAATEDSDVRVCSVVGFPLGSSDADSKRYETEMAVDLGAHEIDMVINVGLVKDGDRDELIFRELRDIVEAADERPVKVILETGYLEDAEIDRVVELFKRSGAAFVKTSTGFGPRGATVEEVARLRTLVGPGFGVKASGGIRDLAAALAMIESGASRLGTSASVRILEAADAAEMESA